MWFLDTIPDDVHRVHLTPLVTVAHVPVDVAAQVAAVFAVGTLESRFLATGVQQMPAQAALLLEDATALRARVLFLSGDRVVRL